MLEEAIRYVKELQEQEKVLEEERKKKKGVESKVEARVSERNVLIRIQCEKQKGLVLNIITEIEKLRLSVLSSSVIPFGTSILDITIIAQVYIYICIYIRKGMIYT